MQRGVAAAGRQGGHRHSPQGLAHGRAFSAGLLVQTLLQLGLAAAFQAEALARDVVGAGHGGARRIQGVAGRGAPGGGPGLERVRIDEVDLGREAVVALILARTIDQRRQPGEAFRPGRVLDLKLVPHVARCDAVEIIGDEVADREARLDKDRVLFVHQVGRDGAETGAVGAGAKRSRRRGLDIVGRSKDVQFGVQRIGEDRLGIAHRRRREGRGVQHPAQSVVGPDIVGEGGGAPVAARAVRRAPRRGLGAFQRDIAAHGARATLFDAFASLGQQARGALLALTHPLAQLARGAVVALLDLVCVLGQAAADVVQGLGRAALRLGDALGQTIRDAGDLAAQPLQRQGVLIVGTGQALVHGLGVTLHLAIQLLVQRLPESFHVRRSAAGLNLLDAGVQVLGDAQDLAAHGLDGVGRALLGGAGLIPDRRQGPLDAVHAAFGFDHVKTTHHLDSTALDLTGQGLGQLLEARGFAAVLRLDAALGVAQTQVQRREGPFQPLQGLGGARLSLVQTLSHLGENVRARSGAGGLLDRLHARAQVADGGALTLVQIKQAAGQGPQGGVQTGEALLAFGAGFLLEAAQSLVAFPQFIGDVVDAAGVAQADLVLFFKTAHQTGHGLIDALDGDGRVPLDGFQTVGDDFQRRPQARGPVVLATIDIVQTTRAAAAVIGVGNGRAARQGRDVLVLVRLVHDHGIQPFAQGHARATRKVLGDLASLGVDPLHAPRRCCAH
ncbi:hypothetical protein D3C85_834180 [compost metagenome]